MKKIAKKFWIITTGLLLLPFGILWSTLYLGWALPTGNKPKNYIKPHTKRIIRGFK